MKFGFNAPTAGALATPDNLTRFVVEGEKMGFDYATFSDHVVIPRDIHARYPYSETGEFPAGARLDRHEQLIEVAWIAAKTTRLRLVTSVMVVPHRPPVLAAKQIAGIDVLSGGRLTLGIGAGWMKEEFDALGVPDFAERGKVTDEYMAACIELWTRDAPVFEGKYVRFSGLDFSPKPVQRPYPPIWVGGESGPAMRRTARYGDAWYPIGVNPAFPLDSLKALKTGIDRLAKLTREAGRDPKAVGVAYRVSRYGDAVAPKAKDGERQLFSGTAAEIAGDLRALRDIGVGHVDLSFPGQTVEACLDRMQAFRAEVLARM